MTGHEFLYWMELAGVSILYVAGAAFLVTVIKIVLWRLAGGKQGG